MSHALYCVSCKSLPLSLNSDTQFNMPSQAGTFVGPSDISEYVSFASDISAYFRTSSSLPGDDISVHSIDQGNRTCTFNVMRVSYYLFSKPAFAGMRACTGIGTRAVREEISGIVPISVYPTPPYPDRTPSHTVTSHKNRRDCIRGICIAYDA